MIRHKDLLKSGGTSTIEDFQRKTKRYLSRYLVLYIIASSLNCSYFDRFIDSGGIRGNYACAYHLCLPSLKRGKLLGYASIA